MGAESKHPTDPNNADAAVRITQEQRQQTLERLRNAAADGLLTLDEFGDRTARALAASTNGDLAPIVVDLPAPQQVVPPEKKSRGVIVGIFGGGDRKGRWRVPQRCLVINVFGGGDLDLREATVTGRTTQITVLSLFGGSDIYVPPVVDVDAGGFAIFGDNDVDLAGLKPEVGAPLLRINSYSLFGGTDVSVRLSR